MIADSLAVRVPARIDREIDLAGAWVVPPFADLGLTASRGHPVLIYENLARGRFDFDPTNLALFRERQAEGRAYLLFRRRSSLR